MKYEHITELDNQFRVRVPYYSQGKRKYISKNFHFDKCGGKQLALKSAKSFRDLALFRIKNGIYNDGKKTLRDVIEMMNEQMVRSAETKKKINGLLNNHILKQLNEDMAFVNIDSVMIQKSLNSARNKSNDVIRRLYGLWSNLYKVAIKNKVCSVNLANDVDIPRSKKIINKREQYFDMSLFPKVLKDLEGQRNSDVVIASLKLMAMTGLRPSECLAIEKKSVNYEEHSISIHQSLGSTEYERNVVVPTKTEESIRTVYFPSSLDEELKALKGKVYLFAKADGKIMTVSFLDDFIKRRTKIEFRPYMLRHNVATMILESSSSDLRTLQEILGHSSPVMSQRYARTVESKKRMALTSIWDDIQSN